MQKPILRYSLTSLLFLFLAPIVFASSYTDGKGVTYTAVINKHGVTLKSKRDTIYLRLSCDANSPQYGTGSWGWANGGFLVIFKSVSVGFPRQEIEAIKNYECRF